MTQPPHLPSPDERQQAYAVLARPAQGEPEALRDVPDGVSDLFQQVLEAVAQGHAVRVVPLPGELGTQAAAELLGVSRPHVVKLLEDGALPHHKVGTHRRIQLDDLLTYKEQQRSRSEAALLELAQLDQELGLL